jgi:hypothetical protein
MMMRMGDGRAFQSCRGGAMLKLLAFLLVVFAFGALAWMLFLPAVLTQQLRARTGFDVKVQRLAINPFTGHVDVRGLVLTNPPTFPAREFIELREFRSNARISSFFSDQVVFDTMTIDLARVTLVKRQDGKTNAEVFDQNLSDAPQRLVPAAPSSRRFLVHRLDLKIDRLVVADHSLKQPKVKDYPLHIEQAYTEVTELKQLLAPAVLQNLAPVAVAISDLIPGEMGQALRDVTKTGAELLKHAGRRAEERVKGLFDALEESKKP